MAHDETCMKLMRGIDAAPIERYLIYSSYYQRAELDRLLVPRAAGTGVWGDPFAITVYAERMCVTSIGSTNCCTST